MIYDETVRRRTHPWANMDWTAQVSTVAASMTQYRAYGGKSNPE